MTPCVMVVDDERDVLDLLRDVLEDDGVNVVPVDRPERLAHLSVACKPDLVLVDVMLPGMTGIELAERLQSDGMRDTPMVAMSASPRMLRAAAESGLFEETLPKPFELTALLECVERHVDREAVA